MYPEAVGAPGLQQHGGRERDACAGDETRTSVAAAQTDLQSHLLQPHGARITAVSTNIYVDPFQKQSRDPNYQLLGVVQ